MVVLGALLYIVCAISVIYPLRVPMIPNRLVAVCGVMVSFVIIAANAPPQTKTANAAEQAPAYTSSGGCKTDVNGDMKCSHEFQVNLFGTTSRASSEMKCGRTLAYGCKSSSSAY
ncbi:hypothetical protein [Bradyrhizobium sp. CW10]|uniref:hypothetical protein n=1 Tax=Bradyrhizobium sp. CW10 TaxID=2782683 RepID=UPI001FF73916|nr:hypothetical protein [Bradyrhizobium sp. CW10]MCK1466634.1 hypothetical protein [Bradyrhizobium sp. CW10]